MIKCRDCGSDQYEGSIFCEECGAFLLAAANEEVVTDVLPFSDFAQKPPPLPLAKKSLEPVATATQLTFVLPGKRQRLQLTLEKEIRIGRGTAEMHPELDLTDYEGAEYGVSRLHAVIQSSQQGIVLIDLNSTNGTMLNAYRLPPNEPYPLRSGDELRFGDLLVHLFF